MGKLLQKLFPSSNRHMNIKFLIYRYNSLKKSKLKYDFFAVPYNKGMTVLDVITYIYKHLDPTLAFRYECRQGICGTCGVMLNKKPVLSCSTQIDANLKTQMIEPLANFPVEKDLIVNLEPVLKRYLKIKPYLDKIHKVIITKKKSNESKAFRKCIECGCCIAGAPEITQSEKGCMDPMSLVKIARYVTDPRDGLDRKAMAKKNGIDKYSDALGKKLTLVCPRGIPIDEAIALLKK
ncbi:MAG: Succinate dehydrogenase and fumarate reductase iron-sulfur protein [Candidatus Roizmanbacteria bacterium GW2011_GWA2_34_18]|uniref:Succinate dehydrogenase and fumarate reductase iron-sulfur protein n=1 Tax=Candidatus Roizmanbacteria bacterium GW2011_GWA2_34_18 TaxID=1618477 RepID=A0A0G0B9U6_9BACT|nr:MAG: Succinate dehydrogenase and fumarate reductase iron-sulfur protein [Candidatus Roizmanbacteria bacterium GW2011_GWA2_34_18]